MLINITSADRPTSSEFSVAQFPLSRFFNTLMSNGAVTRHRTTYAALVCYMLSPFVRGTADKKSNSSNAKKLVDTTFWAVRSPAKLIVSRKVKGARPMELAPLEGEGRRTAREFKCSRRCDAALRSPAITAVGWQRRFRK